VVLYVLADGLPGHVLHGPVLKVGTLAQCLGLVLRKPQRHRHAIMVSTAIPDGDQRGDHPIGGQGLECVRSVRVVEVTIRTYERRDAIGVADVFYRSVREVALSDYTPEQVRAWVPGRWDAEREHRRSGDGRLVLVAADEPGHVVAFIDLEPDGHINRLFCAPEVAGRGVASRLYDAIETAACAQGIQRLFTEASELARRFFERKGFTVLERQDMILRGVPIHNYRMAKTLG
jgi:putative acetyltransferase